MDSEPSLLEPPIDRTPYAGFWYVIVICLIYLIVGSVLLWGVAGKAKRNHWLRLPQVFTEATATPSLNNPLQKYQDQAEKNVQDLTNKSLDAAKQGAQDAVKNEIDSQLQQLQNTVNSPALPK